MSSTLLDSLAAAFRGDATRRDALEAALREGLPGPRSEAWKYTSLRALERRAFAAPSLPTTVDAARLAEIPAPRLVFVNGRFDADLSTPAALPRGVTRVPFAEHVAAHDAEAADHDAEPAHPDVFARLNRALAEDGAVLRVAAGTAAAATLHLVQIGAPTEADLAWHLRHRIELGDGATLRLVEHQLGDGAHRHLATSVLALRLGRGARVEHVRIQHEADGATGFARSDAVLAEGAHYARLDLELGAGLSRHALDVRLAGPGARLTANGVLLAAGRRHLDTRLNIVHAARDTGCELLWRGIGAGRGRVVFHGGITIAEGADGSDAGLSNKNLLLGTEAEIDTQPVLVIHADEVQAAHGATVGQLDPTALFYLRSRGLPPDDARRLLTAAFVREPLAALDDALLTLPRAALDRALAALEAAP